MCPLCVSSLVLAAAGATSAGGVTALIVRAWRRKKSDKPETPRTEGEKR
jgi:hypothetical protein